MSQQLLNTGTRPNDGTGDTLRAGAQKINANFADLYANTLPAQANNAGKVLSTDGTNLTWITTAGAYILPQASTSVLGGVKVDGTTISISGNGIISATGQNSYTLPVASTTTLGGVILDGNTIRITGGVISAVPPTSISGNAATVTNGVYTTGSYINPPWISSISAAKVTGLSIVATSGSYTDLSDRPVIPASYTLPTSTTTVLGGVKIDGTTITINNGVISANQAVTSAAGLTGTTLAPNVVNSSLTSVGTLQYLTVANTITGNISGNAATVTNGVYTTGSYYDPSWITALDYTKLIGAPGTYTLPIATASVLGGVKPDGITITVTNNGVISAPQYSLPISTTTTLGGVKPDGSSITANNGVISANANYLAGTSLNPSVINSSLVSLGTVTTGVWHASPIANTYLANSSITINSTVFSLGGSGTITANTSNSLNFSTGFSYSAGSSFNGSTANTLSIDSTVVATVSGNQTLQNKTMSGAVNSFSNIPNSALTNSSVTINGVNVSLGSSATISTSTTSTLTIGTGLTGTSFNGATPVTIAIDSTVVATLTGLQTLTNKTISGASNTISNISNGSLQNSSITVNGTAISLGGTATVTAAAGTLTGTTLNSTVVTSSLTSVGTLTSGAIGVGFTAIPNSALANSSVTINGTSVSLGGTGTVAVNAANITGTTLASGVTGSSLTSVGTLTSGAIGTGFTAIPNTALANNTITINSTPVALGGSITVTSGALPSRTVAAVTTTSLAAGASGNFAITGFKGYSLYSIQVTAAAWVTIYSSVANRTSDASRTSTTDPTPGSGVIAEAITSGATTVYFSPAVAGYSAEASPTTSIPIKVYNNGASATTITVTLTLLQTEN